MSVSKLSSLALLVTCMLVFDAKVYSQPRITGLSGTLIHKATLTISGSNFGTKPTAAPLRYDDFSAGTNGAVLSGWDLYSSGGSSGRPAYSNAVTRPNENLSARADFTGSNYNSSFGWLNKSPAFTTAYVDFWWYYDAVHPYSRNHKWIRFYGSWDNNTQDRFMNIYCDTSSGGGETTHYDAGNGSYTKWIDNYGPVYFGKHWRHFQWWMNIGTAGSANGTSKIWYDSTLVDNATNVNLWGAGLNPYNTLWIGHYLGHDAAGCPTYGDANSYFANVYVDTTMARVQVCSGSTWASPGQCEIQIPSAWSTSAITVTLNQGGLASLTNQYLYVVDSNGNVNANGFQLVPTGGGSQVQIPQGLTVR